MWQFFFEKNEKREDKIDKNNLDSEHWIVCYRIYFDRNSDQVRRIYVLFTGWMGTPARIKFVRKKGQIRISYSNKPVTVVDANKTFVTTAPKDETKRYKVVKIIDTIVSRLEI